MNRIEKLELWQLPFALFIQKFNILLIKNYFQEKASLHNDKLRSEVENILDLEILKQIKNLDVNLNEENLNRSLEISVEKAINRVCTTQHTM